MIRHKAVAGAGETECTTCIVQACKVDHPLMQDGCNVAISKASAESNLRKGKFVLRKSNFLFSMGQYN